MKNSNLEWRMTYGILTLGILISIVQFLYNRSLWLDEAMLALNIIHKSPAELLQPLDYIQVSPVLFLQLEKLSSLVIPDSEYGLRIIPLLFFGASSLLFYKILSLKFHNKPHTIPLLSALFMFNEINLYYSSEVKQYMGDVFTLNLIYYLTIKTYSHRKQQCRLLAIIGIITIFLSHVAPFILLSSGLYLIYQQYPKPDLRNLSWVFGIWLVFFSIYYVSFVYGHPSKSAQVENWRYLNVFMPPDIFSSKFQVFMVKSAKMVFGDLFNFGPIGKFLLPIFFTLGCLVSLYKKKVNILILSLPILLHLLASSCRLYPFNLRLILYTGPIFIVMIGVGVKQLNDLLVKSCGPQLSKLLFLSFPFLFFFSFCMNSFPIKNEEIKKSLEFIKKQGKKEDHIYVHSGAVKAFQYYQEIGLFNYSNVYLEETQNKGFKFFLNEESPMRERVWLVFSHDIKQEKIQITRKVMQFGGKLKSRFSVHGTSAYLFEINYH